MNISHVHSQGTPRGYVSTSKKQNNKGDMESRELETTKETGEGRGWSGGDVKFYDGSCTEGPENHQLRLKSGSWGNISKMKKELISHLMCLTVLS